MKMIEDWIGPGAQLPVDHPKMAAIMKESSPKTPEKFRLNWNYSSQQMPR